MDSINGSSFHGSNHNGLSMTDEDLRVMTGPPMSAEGLDKFITYVQDSRSTGNNGCMYLGASEGVVCKNAITSYSSTPSYMGHWEGNVLHSLTGPVIDSPGGLSQIMLGGGAGNESTNPCLSVCSCDGNPDCTCASPGNDKNPNGHACGWVSLSQDCIAPVLGGTYPSLTACEDANYRGFLNPSGSE